METDPALEDALQETERLIIKQEINWLEVAANTAANAADMPELGAFGEMANEYKIYSDDHDGSQKFKVIETSDYCGLTGRCCCRPNHALKLHMFRPDDNETELMYMDRPCNCAQCCSCCQCCRQQMKVYQGDLKADGEPNESHRIGYIQEPIMGGMFSPTLNVMEREGDEPFATIKANACCCIGGICCDHTFMVTDPSSGEYMGKIVKEKPEGLAQAMKELGTDADNFTMYVPKDMDVKKKASMLASLHLIDYWFFEKEGDAELDFVNSNCKFKCCDMYCCGCICPCSCDCGGGNGDNDDDDRE